MSDDPPECTSLPIPGISGKSSSGGGSGGDGNAKPTAAAAITDDPNRNRKPSPQGAAAAENGSATKDVRRASPSGGQVQDNENQQNASGGDKKAASASASYFTEAMSSLYATTVDAPCQRVHELEHTIQETIQESFLNCQQFDFLHFLKTEEGHVDESLYARNAPVGPSHCEYCGANSSDLCEAGCERPRLFFRNKRPPFGRKEGWDSETEYRLRSGNDSGGGGDDQAAAASVDAQRNGTGIATGQEDDDDVLTSFNSLAADGIRDEEAQLKAEEDAWCTGGLKKTFAC
mmetsp:Transcript_16258/g.46715  ORF Transcript_16258/g.46715 Transcript_16258/m.46715 type:complete len:289 (-) Transcript_16258:1690-2556(-)